MTSVVGRYLEHSRIFYFFNGGREQIYVGSADLMERNLERRGEILFPLEDPELIRHMLEDVLDLYLRDNQLAYAMLPDGRYARKNPSKEEQAVNVLKELMRARRRS